ncbi:helix-turn-helix domain-containing protein [Asticcacaulis sp.]|uniref:helix-turn-helix domain-containing protein n=1 Tax=Asticcacaulis sp. TaxID=1872648 RepID=UPI002C886E76|nr:helix-turn-helix domain-containing protein [Asticcacaulis sp.]HTM81576.1 helix-turn-helix domain-containing protein [Asticcacaulis sp.]
MEDVNIRAAKARKGSPFLNTAQAAFYMSMALKTLEQMRSEGRGPPYRRHGRHIRYHIDDLDTWSAGERKGPGEKDRLQ